MRELSRKTDREAPAAEQMPDERESHATRDRQIAKKTSTAMLRAHLAAGSEGESQVAEQGTREDAAEFPHRESIERSFGAKLSATAHTGGIAAGACEDLGAEAYTMGSSVVFGQQTPSLHTAAHEAAHVMQQRAGTTSASSEAEADAVADRVVAGQSAASMLPAANTGDVAAPAVQMKKLPEHQDPNYRPTTPPDMEKPVNWNTGQGYGPPPQIPQLVRLDPGFAPPTSPNTTRPGPGRGAGNSHHTHHQETPLDRWQEEQDKGKVRWTHDLSVRRGQDWGAYQQVAVYYQNYWNAGVPPIQGFQQAQSDPALKGSRLGLPSDDWKGDLETLVGAQEVGGGKKKVGDVFDGDTSSLSMSAGDKRAADHASTRHGRNKTKHAFQSVGAEEALADAAFKDMTAAAKTIRSERAGLSAAVAAIDNQKAKDRQEAAEGELAALQKEVDGVKSVMSFMFSLPEKFANIEETGKGLVGEAAHALWDLALDVRFEQETEELKAKIARAQADQKDATTRMLAGRYNQAAAAVAAAVTKFSAARSRLEAARTSRVQAYDDAGAAVYRAAGGGQSGRQVEAIVASIPRVETIVAQLANIKTTLGNGSTDPPYNREAGIGFAMALYAQTWEAYDLPKYVDWLFKVRWLYAEKLNTWLEKLNNLNQIKSKLEGKMAGGS